MNTKTKRVLRLTLKKRWFDMIARGEKREEYRVPSNWIMSRLRGKRYDVVQFKNGYGATAPMVEVEFLGWEIGYGRLSWGAGFDKVVVIYLGRVLKQGVQA